MPVKRRPSKSIYRGRFPEFCIEQLTRGPDASFLAGVGYFDLVASKPACLEHATEEERETILAAMSKDWRKQGARIIADWNGPTPPWALREFGEP